MQRSCLDRLPSVDHDFGPRPVTTITTLDTHVSLNVTPAESSICLAPILGYAAPEEAKEGRATEAKLDVSTRTPLFPMFCHGFATRSVQKRDPGNETCFYAAETEQDSHDILSRHGKLRDL